MIELHHGDSAEVLQLLRSDSVDLTVTSPPYDNLREYKGFVFDFETIAKELYRVTKPGGVIVWVVGDATVKGSETGTSFRQALYFKEIGFNLHDTMIYNREGPPLSHNRYEQKFEFMFVFSKGKPLIFNGIMDPALMAGKRRTATMRQDGDKLSSRSAQGVYKETKLRGNIWIYAPGHERDNATAEKSHPAVFPEALARDHILSWSNPGDTVLDPFLGSGTTGKIAVLLNRNFIGIEISGEYLAIARERIERAELLA